MELEAKRYEELAHKLQEHEQQITEQGELITEQGEQIKGNAQYEFILLWLFTGEILSQVPRVNEIPQHI